jgi:hypothetical protein
VRHKVGGGRGTDGRGAGQRRQGAHQWQGGVGRGARQQGRRGMEDAVTQDWTGGGGSVQ